MSYQSEVLADSPVLFLPLSEASGATCADLSTNHFVGTANGTFTRGTSLGTGFAGVSPGITLGGTASDFVSVPDANALDITGDVTYECFVVPNLASLNTSYAVMSKGYQTGSSDQGYTAFLRDSGGSKFGFLSVAFSGTTLTTSAAGSITNATVYHLAFTRTAAGVGTTYINGSQVDQRTVAATVAANSQPFVIGGSSGGGTVAFPYKGVVAAVAAYNTALSSTRIAAHYAARNLPPSAPVSGYSYQFAS